MTTKMEIKQEMKPQCEQYKNVASQSLSLPPEDCKKFARLKVKCLVAEGRLFPKNYELLVHTFAEEVGLSWTRRKVERINAMYTLHQLMRLELDISEVLDRFKYRTQWVRKILDFRGHILYRITREHRKVIFFSQFIDNQEFTKENCEVSSLVDSMDMPKLQDYLCLPCKTFHIHAEKRKKDESLLAQDSKPNDDEPRDDHESQKNYENILNNILKPLLNSHGPDGPSKDHEVITKHFPNQKRRKLVRCSAITHKKEEYMQTIAAEPSNQQVAKPIADIMDQPVQTIELEDLVTDSQGSKVIQYSPLKSTGHIPPGGLVQRYKRLCPFINKNETHFKTTLSKTNLLTIVGQPISKPLDGVSQDGCLKSGGQNSLLRKCKRKTEKSGERTETKSVNEKPLIENCEEPKESNKRKSRNKKKCQKTNISASATSSTNIAASEHDLKQLCLTRKCVVRLERIKKPYCGSDNT